MKLFLRIMILSIVMFSMNIHVFAGRKCSKSHKTLHAFPASVQVKETEDDFQSRHANFLCVNINPVIIHQEVTAKPVIFSTSQKTSRYHFFQPNHYSNPPFAPPDLLYTERSFIY